MQWVMSSGWHTETPDRWSLSDGVLYGDASSGPVSLSVGDENWKNYRATLHLQCPDVPTIIEVRQGTADGARQLISLQWDGVGWVTSASVHGVTAGMPSSQTTASVATVNGGKGVAVAVSLASVAGMLVAQLGGKRIHSIASQSGQVAGELLITVKSGTLALCAVSVQSAVWQDLAQLPSSYTAMIGTTISVRSAVKMQSSSINLTQVERAANAWPIFGPLMLRLQMANQTLHQRRLSEAGASAIATRILRIGDGSTMVLLEESPDGWQGSIPQCTQVQNRSGKLLSGGGRLPPMPMLGQLASEAAVLSGFYSSTSL